jgi:hypothetical protein
MCPLCARRLQLSDLFGDIQSYRRTYYCPRCGHDVTEALHQHVEACPLIAQSLSGSLVDRPDTSTSGVIHDSRLFIQCLATRGPHTTDRTRLAVAFAISVIVTVVLMFPLVPSLGDLFGRADSDPRSRVAIATGVPLSSPATQGRPEPLTAPA